MFGFNVIDLLLAIFFVGVGEVAAQPLNRFLPSILVHIIGYVGGVSFFLMAAAPIYRTFRLMPMGRPRCPCCKGFQTGFYVSRGWPRMVFGCPSCKGEFVVWFSGEVGDTETWDKPVLALKWPYVLGRYQRMHKPMTDDVAQQGSVR